MVNRERLARPAEIEALTAAVLAGPGQTSTDLRQSLARGENAPPELAAYVEKVRRHAYKVTAEDLDGLRQAGYSEDAIFELTLGVALGAALRRWDAGVRALEGEHR